MAHYALLDENNVVTTVIVGIDENTDGIDWEQNYANLYNQTCKRTSYNTIANTHIMIQKMMYLLHLNLMILGL
jgi:hypothetical protein